MEFQEVVKEHRKKTGLSLRGFAKVLSENPLVAPLSHETIHYWETGFREPHPGRFYSMLFSYSDWRKQFATDCIESLTGNSVIDNDQRV